MSRSLYVSQSDMCTLAHSFRNHIQGAHANDLLEITNHGRSLDYFSLLCYGKLLL